MTEAPLALEETDEPDAIVLGAGIVGVSTAYFLARAGRSVVVLDQLPGPALDTSFANGGQVSVCHAEPWATPHAPFKALRWLMDDDAPLLFRPHFDPWQWWWLVSWLAECLPQRTRRNTIDILRLALHSRTLIKQIRADENLVYDHDTSGILHVFRDPAAFEDALHNREMLREHGLALEVTPRERIAELEPALAGIADEFVGGTYSPEDESGDAHQFTVALTARCQAMGVRFLWGQRIVGLPHDRVAGEIQSVRVQEIATARYHAFKARHYVLALGTQSAQLARTLGLNLNIYPCKGYSVTLDIAESAAAPRISVTDDRYKTVFTRLGNRLRIAGTAELAGYDHDLSEVRCRAMMDLAQRNFPRAGNYETAIFWSGLRPSTPSNFPYVGRTKFRNLLLNTGHGTLGWTMGPGSGQRVAEMIGDRP